MGGEARGSKPNNSELNLMDQVGGAHLAYAAVLVSTLYLIDTSPILVLLIQARFALSSKSRWAEKDGIFSYRTYYYGLMDLIDECEDVAWKDSLFKHYNM